MHTADAILGWATLAVWVGLSAAALNLWRVRRDSSAGWLAYTFGSLASVTVIGAFLGEDNAGDLNIWLLKGLVTILFLFPYLLYRFFVTIVGKRRWIYRAATALTVAVVAATFALPRFPEPDEPRTPMFTAYLLLVALQWSLILLRVSFGLWRAGRDQPAVAKKRMWLMGAGALTLVVILVSGVFSSSPSNEPTIRSIVTQSISLFLAPMFLFGFAPPAILRAQWRRKEEAELRKMEIGLVRAISREEIANELLPVVVKLLGGRGAVLFDEEGSVLGQRGLRDHEISRLRAEVPLYSEQYAALEAGDARIIPMETGWLVVISSPFTPFFGTEELQMLSASAVLADLALGRAKLFELETQAREAMRDFVAIASHDLRTPVTVIQGFADLLNNQWDHVDDHKKREYAEAISRQVGALERLIRDLLTVSKLDVDEVDVAPQRVDVRQLADEAVMALAGDVEVTISGDEHCYAIADADHVSRMLTNYMKNALVYGAPPFQVEVVGQGESVTVYIRDNGPGVPEDFVPHLFEKFARVDKKKSRAVQGTGLGLSIVRGLARANGGDAWYDAQGATGACFVFSLPRAAAAEPASNDVDLPRAEVKGTV